MRFVKFSAVMKAPLDTDLHGLPDYLADANGNGLVDAGETDWGVDTDGDFLPDRCRCLQLCQMGHSCSWLGTTAGTTRTTR